MAYIPTKPKSVGASGKYSSSGFRAIGTSKVSIKRTGGVGYFPTDIKVNPDETIEPTETSSIGYGGTGVEAVYQGSKAEKSAGNLIAGTHREFYKQGGMTTTSIGWGSPTTTSSGSGVTSRAITNPSGVQVSPALFNRYNQLNQSPFRDVTGSGGESYFLTSNRQLAKEDITYGRLGIGGYEKITPSWKMDMLEGQAEINAQSTKWETFKGNFSENINWLGDVSFGGWKHTGEYYADLMLYKTGINKNVDFSRYEGESPVRQEIGASTAFVARVGVLKALGFLGGSAYSSAQSLLNYGVGVGYGAGNVAISAGFAKFALPVASYALMAPFAYEFGYKGAETFVKKGQHEAFKYVIGTGVDVASFGSGFQSGSKNFFAFRRFGVKNDMGTFNTDEWRGWSFERSGGRSKVLFGEKFSYGVSNLNPEGSWVKVGTGELSKLPFGVAPQGKFKVGTPDINLLGTTKGTEGLVFASSTEASILQANLPKSSKGFVQWGEMNYPVASAKQFKEFRTITGELEYSKSPFIVDKNNIRYATRTLGDKGGKIYLEWAKNTKGYTYGSGASQQQLLPDLYERRGLAGDWDYMNTKWGSNLKGLEPTKNLILAENKAGFKLGFQDTKLMDLKVEKVGFFGKIKTGISNIGTGISNYYKSAGFNDIGILGGYPSSNFIGGASAGASAGNTIVPSLLIVNYGIKKNPHTIDIHTEQTLSQDLLTPNFMDKSVYGFNINQKPIKIGGNKFQPISENVVRKGGSTFTLRVTDSNDLFFAPETHRAKDVGDFFLYAENQYRGITNPVKATKKLSTLKGMYDKNFFKPNTKIIDDSITGGYNRNSFLGLSREPLRDFSPSRTGATPSPSFSFSPSVSKSLSPSMSRSPSYSPSGSFSLSPSVSKSLSPSMSRSTSRSPSPSISISPSTSPSSSISISPSYSPSSSISPPSVPNSPLPFGWFYGGKGEGGGFAVTSFNPRYVGSVLAGDLRIFGKKPSGVEVSTGVGVRPLLRVGKGGGFL